MITLLVNYAQKQLLVVRNATNKGHNVTNAIKVKISY